MLRHFFGEVCPPPCQALAAEQRSTEKGKVIYGQLTLKYAFHHKVAPIGARTLRGPLIRFFVTISFGNELLRPERDDCAFGCRYAGVPLPCYR